MSYIINLLILCFSSMVMSFIITRALIILLPRFGITDTPGKRRVHKYVTPRGAGIAFFIIFSLFLPAFEYIQFGQVKDSLIVLYIFWPVSIVSFWDDLSPVPIPIRLFVQILFSVIAIMTLVHPYQVLHSEISRYLDLAIASFALLTFLNVYNFLDGIDGITGVQSLHLAINILILSIVRFDIIPNSPLVIVIATIILGWVIGFLYFNWHPAKIFLGDVGSVSLGFLLGICLLIIASGGPRLFIACVISSLYYIADGGLTILIRIVKGERIWEPHLQHFFQKSVKSGKSHSKTVKRIMKCNIFLMLLSLNSLFYPVISVILALLVVMITLIRSII